MPPVDLAGAQTVIQHEHYADNLYVRVPDGRWALVWQIFSEDELKRIRARFNKIATASDLPELNHHLRGVINLLSGNGIKLDYADLAVDLYNYSYAEGRTKVRLKWGQDFCRQIKNDEN